MKLNKTFTDIFCNSRGFGILGNINQGDIERATIHSIYILKTVTVFYKVIEQTITKKHDLRFAI